MGKRVEPPRWFLIVGIWSGIGLFDAAQTVFSMRSEGMHHAWVRLFATLVLSWLPWAPATPAIVGLGRLYPPSEWNRPSVWFVHLGAIAGLDLMTATWGALLEALLNPWAPFAAPPRFSHVWPAKFYEGMLSSLLLYAFVLAISLVLESRERLAAQETEAARLSEQLSKEQLNALRRQIEPHFLFNSLNAIAGLVREHKNQAAVGMIVGLSEYLRRALKHGGQQKVPLRTEVEFVERYLEIQKARFAHRLEFSMQIPEKLLAAQVPSWVLQPLVENAIKHGISKQAAGGAIRVAAFGGNGMLKLRVYNDGPLLAAGEEKTNGGIGISNLRARLETLYGERFELSLRNSGQEGVEVSISLPYQER